MAKKVPRRARPKNDRASSRTIGRDSETGIPIAEPAVKIPKALRAAIQRGVALAKEKAQSGK